MWCRGEYYVVGRRVRDSVKDRGIWRVELGWWVFFGVVLVFFRFFVLIWERVGFMSFRKVEVSFLGGCIYCFGVVNIVSRCGLYLRGVGVVFVL